jgi:hypothetical protein
LGPPADFVVGLRFFAPILPMLSICYVGPLSRVFARLSHPKLIATVALLLVLVSDAAMVVIHQRFLHETAQRRDFAVAAAQQSDRAFVHGGAAELLSPAWGAPAFELSGDLSDLLTRARGAAKDGATVVVIAQGPQADSLAQLAPEAASRRNRLTVLWVSPETGMEQ